MRRWALAIMVGLFFACADKAEPGLHECERLESGHVEQAYAACTSAVAADATSKAGIAAATKLKAMEAAYRVAKQEWEDAEEAERRCTGGAWGATLEYGSLANSIGWHASSKTSKEECDAEMRSIWHMATEMGAWPDNAAVPTCRCKRPDAARDAAESKCKDQCDTSWSYCAARELYGEGSGNCEATQARCKVSCER